jgi:hypothetical protein
LIALSQLYPIGPIDSVKIAKFQNLKLGPLQIAQGSPEGIDRTSWILKSEGHGPGIHPFLRLECSDDRA